MLICANWDYIKALAEAWADFTKTETTVEYCCWASHSVCPSPIPRHTSAMKFVAAVWNSKKNGDRTFIDTLSFISFSSFELRVSVQLGPGSLWSGHLKCPWPCLRSSWYLDMVRNRKSFKLLLGMLCMDVTTSGPQESEGSCGSCAFVVVCRFPLEHKP